MTTKVSIDTVARVASTVREARESLHLTQGQLAKSAQVSRTFIGNLENGHTRAELGKVLDVITALGLSPSVILNTPLNPAEAHATGVHARSRRTKAKEPVSPMEQVAPAVLKEGIAGGQAKMIPAKSSRIEQTLALIERANSLPVISHRMKR